MTPTTLFDDPRVVELLGGDLTRALVRTFSEIVIAEEEIAAARGGKTEKDDSDPLWRSFGLLCPRVEMPELLFRAHCRELLERVSAGEDTRPGTDAEIMAVISRASQEAPPTSGATALQLRLFKRRFPEQFAGIGFDNAANEELYAWEAGEVERMTRKRLTVKDRRL